MARIEAKNVIVGAGAMGSAAAYHLAKRGEPFVLLEQFPLGHDRGSSHGLARITRHSYADPRYARLMLDAFRAWRELEAEACQALYVRTGGVTLCPGIDYVARIASSLESLDVPHRRLTGRELNRANPAFGVSDEMDVVFEPDAGMLCAARAVALQVALAREIGGDKARILENAPVRSVDLGGGRPVVTTDTDEFVADRLIVSAGGWLKRILPEFPVPVKVTRQQVVYFRPNDPAPFQIGRLPVFIYKGGQGTHDEFYGMPAFQGLGVKVARHGGPEFDPDIEDRTVGDEYRRIVGDFCRQTLPALADAPIDLTETCLYTVAPEEKFHVDFYPGRTDVIVASPCSGHGFKFSCLIGRVLADLVTQGATEIRIDPWRTASAD